MADEVWETVDRHLFADASGRRHGPPRIGSWWGFTRIPSGPARTPRPHPLWETYRLVGTLDGHFVAYQHPQLPAEHHHRRRRSASRRARRCLAQPAGCAAPAGRRAGRGPITTGRCGGVHRPAGGDLVLPVRLPQGRAVGSPGHFLADPSVWHKIDLCGADLQSTRSAGGITRTCWCIEPVFESASTRVRRAEIPAGRRAGVDANVSNLAVASFPGDQPDRLVVDQIDCTPEQQKAAARAAKKSRARHKALDRSRRNTNPDQYGRSARQATRAARRAAAGLAAQTDPQPGRCPTCPH